MSRRLLLLRHGRTAWNESGRAQGHADVGLDDLGHAQAADAAAYLAGLGPVALWTSDLARTRQTCAYVERATGLTAVVDRRLREYDVGSREEMGTDEFAQHFPEAFTAWRDGADDPRVPGAESTGEVARRIVPALREQLSAIPEGALCVVVTHGAALKVGLVGLLGWPLDVVGDLDGIENCAWAEVGQESDGRLRLAGYNLRARPDFAPAGAVG